MQQAASDVTVTDQFLVPLGIKLPLEVLHDCGGAIDTTSCLNPSGASLKASARNSESQQYGDQAWPFGCPGVG